MKFVPDFLRRKQTPDPTKPETLEETPPPAAVETAPEEKAETPGMMGRLRKAFTRSSKKDDSAVADAPAAVELPKKEAPAEDKPVAEKQGMMGGLKKRLFGGKKEAQEASETIAEETQEGENVSGLQKVRNSLASLVSKKKKGHKANAVLIIAGAGIAVAGMAADMMFLGGAGTLAVLGMIYSDYRNAQHIGKITEEIGKIDDKIDELRKANKPVPDFSPALSAVKSSIEDFQASAKSKDVPPEVAEELEKLRQKVEHLQDRIKPANDEAEPAPKKNVPPPPAA